MKIIKINKQLERRIYELEDVYFRGYITFTNECFNSYVDIHHGPHGPILKTVPMKLPPKHSLDDNGYYLVKDMVKRCKEEYVPIQYLHATLNYKIKALYKRVKFCLLGK